MQCEWIFISLAMYKWIGEFYLLYLQQLKCYLVIFFEWGSFFGILFLPKILSCLFFTQKSRFPILTIIITYCYYIRFLRIIVVFYHRVTKTGFIFGFSSSKYLIYRLITEIIISLVFFIKTCPRLYLMHVISLKILDLL